jgi:hypothetical protein
MAGSVGIPGACCVLGDKSTTMAQGGDSVDGDGKIDEEAVAQEVQSGLEKSHLEFVRSRTIRNDELLRANPEEYIFFDVHHRDLDMLGMEPEEYLSFLRKNFPDHRFKAKHTMRVRVSLRPPQEDGADKVPVAQ